MPLPFRWLCFYWHGSAIPFGCAIRRMRAKHVIEGPPDHRQMDQTQFAQAGPIKQDQRGAGKEERLAFLTQRLGCLQMLLQDR